MASIYSGLPDNIEKTLSRNPLVVQWLGLHAFTARDLGSNPSPGTKIPQAVHWPQNKNKKMLTKTTICKGNFSSGQSHSCVQLFATPWITARQASLSITNSQSLLRFTSIKLVMPSSHLILCRPLLLLPPILPSMRVFSKATYIYAILHLWIRAKVVDIKSWILTPWGMLQSSLSLYCL